MLTSKIIGGRIAQARKKANISQAQLAEQLFISPQAVGKWERGESMPDITTLNRLAEVFGVDLNYFSDSFSSDKKTVESSEPRDQSKAETPISKPRKQFDWNWDMSKGHWVNADFSGLKNLKDKFSASYIKNCKFIGSELSELNLKANYIENCDFSRSDLRNSKVDKSYLSKNDFVECLLIDTEFEASEIKDCNFSSANFSGSEFRTSEFRSNKIENAIWNLTSFKSSHLSNITFNGHIEDCVFEYCSFSKVTFQNATLINTFFKCKTLKHLKFVNCTSDRMTYEFLKNGKADVSGIVLIPEV